MKKNLVVYYSSTGNNRYLAQQIAHDLDGDLEALRPRLSGAFFIFLSSFFKFGAGINRLKHDINTYDNVVLCGPIWMGMLLSPLRDLVLKHREQFKNLFFATCCGSSYAAKDDKFGYGKVFSRIREAAGGKRVYCEAFPITLVIPEDKTGDHDAIMKTRLSDENFKGEIRKRLDVFIKTVSSTREGGHA